MEYYHTNRSSQPTPTGACRSATPLGSGSFGGVPSLPETNKDQGFGSPPNQAKKGAQSVRFDQVKKKDGAETTATHKQRHLNDRGRNVHDLDDRTLLCLDDPSLSSSNDRPIQRSGMTPLTSKLRDLDSDRPHPLLSMQRQSGGSQSSEPPKPLHTSPSDANSLRRGQRRESLQGTLRNTTKQQLPTAGSEQGRDWRFLQGSDYLDVREKLHSEGRPDAARKLLDGILTGTKQAIARGSYPFVEKCIGPTGREVEDVRWIDLWRYRHQVPRVNWLTAESIELPIGSEYSPMNAREGFEPPITCVAAHPLTAAARVREVFAQWPSTHHKPPFVVHMDAVFNTSGPGDASTCLVPKAIDNVQESFFLRTDLLEHIAATNRFKDVSEDFREQLMNPVEPAMLFCQDVTLMREASEDGFGFLPEPLNINGILVSSLSTERPLIKAKDVSGKKMAQMGGGQALEYADEEQQIALNKYLDCIVKSALTVSDEPVLILSLPGCMDRRSHPLHAVLRSLGHLRMMRGRLFSALILACGTEHLATKADLVVNGDLYEFDGHLKPNWQSCHMTDIADELTTLSVNPVFRGEDPDFESGKKNMFVRMEAADGGKSAFGQMLKRNAGKAQYLAESQPEGKLSQLLKENKKQLVYAQKSNVLMHEIELLASRFNDWRKNFTLKPGKATNAQHMQFTNVSFSGVHPEEPAEKPVPPAASAPPDAGHGKSSFWQMPEKSRPLHFGETAAANSKAQAAKNSKDRVLETKNSLMDRLDCLDGTDAGMEAQEANQTPSIVPFEQAKKSFALNNSLQKRVKARHSKSDDDIAAEAESSMQMQRGQSKPYSKATSGQACKNRKMQAQMNRGACALAL